MIIIDNTNPCKPHYCIYDQHGESSSKGDFVNIAKGIERQTCWTFANSCLNRYISHLKHNNNKHKKWDSPATIIWKMQRK